MTAIIRGRSRPKPSTRKLDSAQVYRHAFGVPMLWCPFPGCALVTWTKLGDEFSDEARDLNDAEHRTHVDALGWSNRRGLDLLIPKRDLRKFGESPDAEAAASGLVAKGWWADRGDCWYVGLRFPEWQLERAVINQRREASALRMRRSRLHKAGDHSLCLAENCPAVTRNVARNEMRDGMRNETRHPVRVGSGATHPPDPEEQDQPQVQEHSVANLQNRQVHNGSEAVADDAPEISIHDAESATAGTGTRARRSGASAA